MAGVVIDLSGRSYLVTGGAQGIGGAVAAALVAAGAGLVVIGGRDAAKAEAAAAALRAAGQGTRVEVALGDLAGAEAASAVAARALALAGGVLDGVVNAAGLTDRGRADAPDARLWDRLMAVNARAPYLITGAAIAAARAAGRPMSVVNILSTNAHCGQPDLAPYAASKGALMTLTKNTAHAHLADRIRVNGIAMGWADTPAERQMQAVTLGKGEGWLAEAAARLPLGRLLSAEEVARLALYLLSDLSGLQTGTVIDLEQRVLGAPA